MERFFSSLSNKDLKWQMTLAAVLAAAVFLGLEFWRYPFFLTDDNLASSLPTFMRANTAIWAGKSLFQNPFLFGGCDFAHSAERAHVLNPLPYLILPLLKGHYYLLLDVMAFFNILLAVLLNTLFLNRLCALGGAEVHPLRLCFLNLGSLFSIYLSSVGAGWEPWTAAAASLPWIALGLMAESKWKGAAIVATGECFLFIAGDFHTFFYINAILFVFVLVYAWRLKKSNSLVSWFFGCLAAGIFVGLMIWPALSGFKNSGRAGGVSIAEQAQVCSLPLPYLLCSLFWGPLARFMMIVRPIYFSLQAPYIYAIALSISSWLLIPVFVRRAVLWQDAVFCGIVGLLFGLKLHSPAFGLMVFWTTCVITELYRNHRHWHFSKIENAFLAVLICITLLISRPYAVAWIIHKIPIYSSLRWPFRELLEFHFFLAGFLALTTSKLRAKVFWPAAGCGLALWMATCLCHQAPSLSRMTLDRKLIVSGTAQRYWLEQKEKIGPNSRIAAVADPALLFNTPPSRVPFSLLGAYDYPSFFEIPSHYGYLMDGGIYESILKERNWPFPCHWAGILSPERGEQLLKSDPATTLVILQSLDPLVIRFKNTQSSWEVRPDPSTLPSSD